MFYKTFSGRFLCSKKHTSSVLLGAILETFCKIDILYMLLIAQLNQFVCGEGSVQVGLSSQYQQGCVFKVLRFTSTFYHLFIFIKWAYPENFSLLALFKLILLLFEYHKNSDNIHFFEILYLKSWKSLLY